MAEMAKMYQSWLDWRDFLKEEKTSLFEITGAEHPKRELFILKKRERDGLLPSDICPVCDGFGEMFLHGQSMYCMCEILLWETKLRMEQDELFPRPQNVALKDLKVYGDPQTKIRLEGFLKKLNEWVKRPERWLTITGPVGTGKTHAMKAIANLFWPQALYVSATDFESRIFGWMNESSLEDNLSIVTRAPILLYDDMGADYGGKFAEAKFRGLIDWRYMHATDHITVITTNTPLRKIMSDASAGDRVASRILDRGVVDIIDLAMVPDFRATVR